jgi:hypothetical protein
MNKGGWALSSGRPFSARSASHGLIVIATFVCFSNQLRQRPQISSDAAIQIKSVLQARQGLTPGPNFLSLPDPNDLSRDHLRWLVWWPPGLPYIVAGLLSLGFSLGTSVLLLLLVSIVGGCFGWLALASKCFVSTSPHAQSRTSLPFYSSATHDSLLWALPAQMR